MTRRRRPVRPTWTIRSFNNLCFPSRSDGANQLAWRRVWAARHRVNTVRLTGPVCEPAGGVVPRAVRSASLSEISDRASGDLVDSSVVNNRLICPACHRVPRRWIYYRQSVVRAGPSALSVTHDETGQLIGQNRSRLQDDHSRCPLSSVTRPPDRFDVAISVSPLLTELIIIICCRLHN